MPLPRVLEVKEPCSNYHCPSATLNPKIAIPFKHLSLIIKGLISVAEVRLLILGLSMPGQRTRRVQRRLCRDWARNDVSINATLVTATATIR